jgi:hypothetical protein
VQQQLYFRLVVQWLHQYLQEAEIGRVNLLLVHKEYGYLFDPHWQGSNGLAALIVVGVETGTIAREVRGDIE